MFCRNPLFFWLTIFLLQFDSAGFAQSSHDLSAYNVQHFTDDDGLPQNTVRSIVPDNYGFIWLATEGGLARFDGHHFLVYDKRNLPGLKSNRMTTIVRIKDPGDSLYVLWEWVQIRDGKAKALTFPVSEISSRFGGRMRDTVTKSSRSTGLPDWLLSYFPMSVDMVMIPLDSGVYAECYRHKVVFIKDRKIISETNCYVDSFQYLFVVENRLFFQHPEGSFSVISRDGTVRRARLEGDLHKEGHYRGRNGTRLFWNLATNSVLLFCNSAFYKLFAGSGLALDSRLIISGFQAEREKIACHHYDEKRNRLFLGSRTGGLFVLTAKKFQVVSESDSDYFNSYYALLRTGDRQILTSKGSVITLSNSDHITLEQKIGFRLDSYTLAMDKDSCIWGGAEGIVYQFDRQLKIRRRLPVGQGVDRMFVSDENILWLGIKSSLYTLDLNEDRLGVKLFDSIGHVTYIVSAGKHTVWVGTDKSLFHVDKDKHHITEINVMKGKCVRSIYRHSDRELWITTYEDGIFLMLDGVVYPLPQDKDNFIRTAHCMVYDALGYFWISTNKGLFRVKRKGLLDHVKKQQPYVYFHYYGREAGFNTNEFNGGCQPCGVRLGEDVIMLPSLDGVVKVNPLNVDLDLPDNPLIIDRVELDKHEIPYSGTIKLPNTFDQLNIQFGTAYFGNAKNIQMQYAFARENKQADKWYIVPPDNTVSFSSLPSGTYILRVRKINGYGKDNFSKIILKLIVPRMYYETWWFKLFVLLGVAMLVFVYFRVRLFYVMKNNRMLELRIARRTRKLTHTLRALESSERSLRRQTQIQEMMIAAISHDIKSPMKYLMLASQRMQKFITRKEYDSLPAFNESIQETAGHVYAILDNLLKYISIQLKKGTIKMEDVNLKLLVEDKINIFKNIAADNHTTLMHTLSDNAIVHSSKDLLAVIIHNLLDNAIKFTANGTISFSFDEREKILMIEDTGTGIDPELKDWLNTRSETQRIEMDTVSGHKGMGLIIVKELQYAVHASIKVGLRDTGGTWVSISFENGQG